MKALFIGDSITKGTQGVNWVAMLSKANPEWKIENAGLAAGTLNKIAGQITGKIESGERYDVVVLQSGYNDILLPAFETKGYWFKKALHHQLKLGNNPLPPGDYEMVLRQTVDSICSQTGSKIVLITTACVGEDIGSALNLRRNRYNIITRKIGREYNCALADVAAVFEKELALAGTGTYFMENFLETAFADKFRCLLGQANSLSKKRKLLLTIDGLHLNTKGAAIFKQVVEEKLLQIEEPVPLYI